MSTHVFRSRILVSVATFIFCAALLTGCGVGVVDHTATGTSALHGMVHGGQQPVSGAVIQLYTVGPSQGSAGNGSAATPMLTRVVTSQADGTFDISGAYSCGKDSLGGSINSPSDQVYLVATGGNPGLTPAADNLALVMVTALGDCANLPSASYVEINEITTAAAAWALAPFAADFAHIGASATNVSGIRNAFLDAALLADSSTGLPATIASNLKVETPKLISLANALASCVNSDGTTGCAPLFTAATPTGSAVPPIDTFAAALNVVKHPGENVQTVFQTISTKPPFAGGLTAFPNDWTMSLTVTGGGMSSPTAMAIDSESNVWVVSNDSPLSGFGPQGTLLSGTGYGVGVIYKSQGIAIDKNDNIWVVDYNNTANRSGPVLKILGVNSGAQGTVVQNSGSPGFYTDIYFASSISADPNGDMFVGNTSSVTVLNNDGSLNNGYLGGNLSAFPKEIAVDASSGVWVPDDNYGVIHITAAGDVTTTNNCCFGSYGVATDAFGNAWLSNTDEDTISAVQSDGTRLVTRTGGGGLQQPSYVAVDAAQNVWFSNSEKSITEIAGQGGSLTTGTPISPSTGARGTGGYGLDASLQSPNYIAPDRSGNIWVASQSSNSIKMFFGIAAPTVTPIQPIPSAP